jgi:hypothetical protein
MNSKAPDCYLYRGLFADPPESSDLLWVVYQKDPDGDAVNDLKLMLGYPSQDEAEAAYLFEMPSRDWFAGITEVKPSFLEPYQLDTQDHREINRDKLGRFASKAGHVAEHLGENVAAWKTGKVVGGIIANFAEQHGVPRELGQLLSETAVQAATATALYARHGGKTPGDLAKKFVAEASAAFVGKVAHGGADHAIAALGGGEHAAAIGALFAGKGSGIGTNTAVSRWLSRKGKQLQSAMASSDHSDTYTFAGTADNSLTKAQQQALYDLTVFAYIKAAIEAEKLKDHAERPMEQPKLSTPPVEHSEPIAPEGDTELLTNAEWDAIASITPEDTQDALDTMAGADPP